MIAATINAMKRRVVFKPHALEHLRWLPVRQQRSVIDRIRRHLVENDPGVETRDKFRLWRGSAVADYELRLGALRVLYRIEKSMVSLAVVGLERGSILIVKGEELSL